VKSAMTPGTLVHRWKRVVEVKNIERQN